ncbi:MAG: hypothetical protein IPN86_02340 [Saprospiraceae bacterium]|nr:hypothetical protein [Saprospiraceae bacterium]
MNTKLEHILSTLENEDLVSLESLIPTKLFGGTKRHITFLQLLLKNSQKSSVKENIPPSQRLLMSELNKMVEKYILIKHSLENTQHKDKVLLAHFRENENEKLFNEHYLQIEKLANNDIKNADFYQYRADVLYERWQFDQLKNRFSNAEANDIITNSEVAFISKKLMEAVSLAQQSALISKKIKIEFIEYLEPYIIRQNYLQHPCISLYYFAIKMIYETENRTWFDKFSKNLSENEICFPTEELKTLYFQAINYCIRKHNSGDKAFSKQLLDFYVIALDKKYLLTNGFLSKNTYRNINTIAIRMGRYDDAAQISTNNVHYLRKEDKESAYKFNMANIYYAKQQYQEALDALREAEFDDHLSNLFAKTLMLKVYFEMNSMRLLDSHLDAMQVYLTRKKIIGYHKTNYSNIVRYTRKLIRVNPYDNAAKAKLAQSIRNEKLLPDRDWLLKMVEN